MARAVRRGSSVMVKQGCSPILTCVRGQLAAPNVDVLRVRFKLRLRLEAAPAALERLPLHPRDPHDRMLRGTGPRGKAAESLVRPALDVRPVGAARLVVRAALGE